MKKQKSRKATPWGGDNGLTATQAFLKQHYELHYENHHRKVGDSCESDMINSYTPSKYPFCAAETFKKNGYSSNGVQRYMCLCGKTFLPTTGTIFDEHRISISEWMEYCLNLFRHVSINVGSWNNKNDFKTSRYWLQKLFLTLEEIQCDIVLSEYIWFDETFYSVRSDDIVCKDNGDKLRGLSQNQICIGVATDKQYSVLLVEGTGKPSQKRTLEMFRSHIKPSSTLIHDEESAHNKLVKELHLISVVHNSKDLKGLPDKENPLNPVNRVHAIMKNFLNSHTGFLRDDIQGYLNIFAFVTNPPFDMLEKVELLIKMAFQNPKSLRYRDFFASKSGF